MNCSSPIKQYSISPFSLNNGEVMLLSLPAGIDVKFCKRNKEQSIKINYQPYWVKFSIEKIDKESIDIVNQNIEYLRPYFSSNFIPKRELTKREILLLSGWDVRLINMFIMRKKGVYFFELNTAGLSLTSIFIMFKFLLGEIEESKNTASYLIIEISSFKYYNNPIFVTKNNLSDVYGLYTQ
jgi:hypothetical protein